MLAISLKLAYSSGTSSRYLSAMHFRKSVVQDFRDKIVKEGQEAFQVAARKSGIADGIAEIQYPA